MYLTLTSNTRIFVQVMGNVTLVLDNNCHLQLQDCLYVLKSGQNLISVSSLNKSNYLIYFDKEILSYYRDLS